LKNFVNYAIILISGEPKVAYMVSMGREEKGMDFVHDPFLVSRFSSANADADIMVRYA